MNTALWVGQGLLGFAFFMAGAMKLVLGRKAFAEKAKWVRAMSPAQFNLLGLVEVLGGLGVVLPRLTGILPWLTPIAGASLVPLMLGAVYTHLRDREGSPAPAALLGFISVLVAYGRFAIVP